MKIVTSPDPRLRQVCEPVEPGDKEIPGLAKKMAKAMYKNRGVGLAAPQVGVLKRLFVFDVEYDGETPKNPQVCINPVFTWRSEETAAMSEGCLSIPGCSFTVTRPVSCTMECTDLDGNRVVYEKATGLLAQCLQHEYDHLDGKTIFENLDPVTRIDALRIYREALEHGARPGDTDFD